MSGLQGNRPGAGVDFVYLVHGELLGDLSGLQGRLCAVAAEG